MIKLKRSAKVNFNKSGSGSVSVKVVIPKDIVEHLGLQNGDYITFNANPFGNAITVVKEETKNE